ncbi:DnaB-like helicase N-terminal domain-containing protein [Microbulbifer sp. DLAB2-AA]|uniref:DnaB-like helicase N-terminal domain-containing protein n=1 Tax=Microbulbifer sp. DLAB2-AA TaxID=3243394 RepID=UPI004038FCE7
MIEENTSPQPHSLYAEKSVLGGLLLDPGCIDTIAEQLGEEDFYNVSHRKIFAAIRELGDDGQILNIDTLAERLDSRDLLSQVGGPAYLEELTVNAPLATNIVAYAKTVRERSTLRQILSAAGEINH